MPLSRQMAHVKVNHEKRVALAREAAVKSAAAKSTGWLDWMWGSSRIQAGTEPEVSALPGGEDDISGTSGQQGLGAEEWAKFYDLVAIEASRRSAFG